ncbi:MAG: hypothetical protein AAB466_00875, partial [Verrucomicrobiota bacterium]
MKNRTPNRCLIAAFMLALVAQTSLWCAQQDNGFTYQGRLHENGQPPDGDFDLTFSLWDGPAGNQNSIQVGPKLTNAPVTVDKGVFAVTVDFGPGVFTGSQRWLEIGVRAVGNVQPHTILAPRQPIKAVPFALYALTPAGPAGPQGLPGTTTADGLTSGTLADERLSANVALLHGTNVFSGTNNFAGIVVLTNANNQAAGAFSGNGAGLTNLTVSAGNVTGTLTAGQIPNLDA